MLTRVVAKQAKTTKVKNKFVSGKKSSKEHSTSFPGSLSPRPPEREKRDGLSSLALGGGERETLGTRLKNTQLSFWWKGKSSIYAKKFGDKVQAKSSNLPRRFCSNSVGTPLKFAAFRSGFDAKYSRASAFWFFLSTTLVFTAFRTHFARKNTSIFMLIGSLSRRKK